MNTPINTAPPTVKVGRWTTAIGLIGIGVMILLQFNHVISFEALKYVWPVLLILLGLEVVLANVIHSEKRIRLGGGSVTILILLMLVSAAQVAIPNWSSIFNKGYVSKVQGSTEIAAGIKRVEIIVDKGNVNVHGSEKASLSYEGRFRLRNASSQEAADRIVKEDWKVNQSGDTLVLSLEPQHELSIHIGFNSLDDEYLNVELPKALEVEVHTKDYSITGDQLDSNVTAVTKNASIKLKNINGKASASTSNASITLNNVKGSVSATTSNSSVHLSDIGGAAQVKSSNGSLTLDRIAGTVTAKTSNSSIKGTSAIGGDWTCTSSNGSISLNVPKNTNAAVKAKTSNSSVKGDIPWSEESGDNKGAATLGDGSNKVELTTSNGSIKVNYGE
ncbi:LiaI-LiaF-like domain-containing protein [Paenibacillus sp. SAF-054]|uniref:LiaI-LiaF-like domain-containing protein n=1 Tax=unclassified Paenibacillus TaxID=185978 RepID=UPI003F8046C0